jgi:hypothetical protein
VIPIPSSFRIAFAVAAFAGSFACGFVVSGWRSASRDAERREGEAEVARYQMKRSYVASEGLEADNRRTEEKDAKLEAARERISVRGFYAGQCLDADGVRLINGEIGAGAAAAESERGVRPAP